MQQRPLMIALALSVVGALGLALLIGCGMARNTPTQTPEVLPTATPGSLVKGTAIGTVPMNLTVPVVSPTEDVKPKTPAVRGPSEPGYSFPGAQPGATMPLAPPGIIATPGAPGTPGTPAGTPTR